MHQARGKHRKTRQGFSLLELSIVVAIMSIVSVLGLEVATAFLGSKSYTDTQNKLTALDTALTQYYRIYGRLPCPAVRNTSPFNSNFGTADCTTTLNGTSGQVLAGMVPFRELNLPISAAIDSYGDRINYAVTQLFTTTTLDFANNAAQIEVRSGILDSACNTVNCEILANPATLTGAAYLLFSSGPDKRGAITKRGIATATACAASGDQRVDSQNCAALTNTGPTSPSLAARVFYDSRYNSGSVTTNYFDDIVVWRGKGQL